MKLSQDYFDSILKVLVNEHEGRNTFHKSIQELAYMENLERVIRKIKTKTMFNKKANITVSLTLQEMAYLEDIMYCDITESPYEFIIYQAIFNQNEIYASRHTI